MKRTLRGLAKLFRFGEYAYFVVITTLLGVAAARGAFTWQLILLLLANWLAVGFAFMINDIEDAPEDAFSKKNFKRNPVSSGLIATRDAKIAALIVGLVAAGFYAVLGLWPFIFGVTCLILGILFSSQTVRLKTLAFFDLLSHGLMMAGLPYLCGYFTYTSRLSQLWFWPFIFVLSLSIYGRLHKEVRNLEGARLSRLRHTAIVLGDRAASVLMLGMLILAVLMGTVSFFMINLIPSWVMVVMAFLIILFMLPPFIRNRRREIRFSPPLSFEEPLVRAAALALILQFVLPWLDQLLQLGIF